MNPLLIVHQRTTEATHRLAVARRRAEWLLELPGSDPQVAAALDAGLRELRVATAVAAEWDLDIDRESENDPAALGRPGS